MGKQLLNSFPPIIFFFILFSTISSDEASKTFIFRMGSQSKSTVFPIHFEDHRR